MFKLMFDVLGRRRQLVIIIDQLVHLSKEHLVGHVRFDPFQLGHFILDFGHLGYF